MELDQLQLINDDPYRDRILFVTSNYSKSERYFQVLMQKGYCIELADPYKADEKVLNTYDLVCLFLDETELVGDVLVNLKRKYLAPSIPCIVVHEGEVPSLFEESHPSIQFLSFQSAPSEFIVKVSLQLRLRKARFEVVSEQVSISTENAALRSLIGQFARDIEEAKEIHDRLLPRSLPILKSASLSALYLPLEAVGGDIYDVWEIDEEHVGLFVADVEGHGLPAAFICAMIKMLIRIEKKTSSSKLLSYLDKVLATYLPDTRFATAISLVYNQVTGSVNISRAGHTPLLLYRKSKNLVEIIEPKGPPLTLGAFIAFEEVITSLESGDQLLIYTDGLTEAMNMAGELLGVERLSREFASLAGSLGITEILGALHSFQENFTDGRTIKDDLTILGLEQK
jgi:serine phosphatase RsbU (regulator of sigma subunit)